jgi:hypothetical protein
METNKASNIYEKLQLSRIKLQAMNLKKSGRNTFSKFSYYELADFMPAVNIIFGELKLYSMFSINDEKKATLTVVNAENPTETVTYQSPTVEVEVKGCSPIQGIGAANTYMKRYLYMNALEIVENDTVDAQAGSTEIEKKDEIEKVGNLVDLNNTYKLLDGMKHSDNTWKIRLNEKAKAMGAVFNKETRTFEIPASS